MLKIAIADDEALFRNGLISILEDYPQYDVICSAIDGESLMAQVDAKGEVPDMFLLDLRMRPLNGIDTTKELSKRYPGCKIIILTSYYSPSFIKYMVDLGVNAFLPKLIQPEELILAIETVHKKGLYLTEDYAKALQSQVAKKPYFDNHESLTKKEREVLYWICHGFTNQEISDKICRSVRTVEGHRQHIIDKTGARNAAALVVYALMYQIIDINERLLEEKLA